MFSLSLTGVSTRSRSFGLMRLFLAPHQLPASVQAVISTLVLSCVLFVSCYTICPSCCLYQPPPPRCLSAPSLKHCAAVSVVLAVVSTQQQNSQNVNMCPTVDTHISHCPKILWLTRYLLTAPYQTHRAAEAIPYHFYSIYDYMYCKNLNQTMQKCEIVCLENHR